MIGDRASRAHYVFTGIDLESIADSEQEVNTLKEAPPISPTIKHMAALLLHNRHQEKLGLPDNVELVERVVRADKQQVSDA